MPPCGVHLRKGTEYKTAFDMYWRSNAVRVCNYPMKGAALKTYLVTGGAGFIGSNFVLHVLSEHPDARVVNVDKLTVRSKKGTRTLNVVDYTTIRSAWVAMKEESSGTEHEGDFTEDKFAEYLSLIHI